MAQPPFKADVYQVEPGATGTRTISRNTTDGALLFIDPIYPTGLGLADMAGLQTIPSIFLVGGMDYPTIQDALDAIPSTSSAAQPSVVLIPSGTYEETLTISQDGVVLMALGQVTITNDDANPTIHIVQNGTSIPKFVRLVGLTVEATDDASTCVYVDGSNTYATGSFTVVTAPLAAGDVLTINGVPLTGVAAGRTSGANNFNVNQVSTTAMAAEIVAAINDPANAFDGLVVATLNGSIVETEAVDPGAVGNGITLTTVTVPPGGVSTSGATLTGGGGVDSEVGLDRISLENCTVLATGVGTKQLDVFAANYVWVTGGTWFGSSSTSFTTASQVGSFCIQNVGWVNDIEVAYTTASPQPYIGSSEWVMTQVAQAGDLLLDFNGDGSTTLAHSQVGAVSQAGDRTLVAKYCTMGNIVLSDTVAATLAYCSRGSITGAVATTLAETTLAGSVVFAATLSETVTFDVSQPDTNYTVLVDADALALFAATARSTTGFTISTTAPFTGTVQYVVIRSI
jgi:hypothetical protein